MIQADPATNSLIITAPEVLYSNLRAIVDKLDTRRAQVVIESLIVEVTADKAAEFGIQWQALGGIDNSRHQRDRRYELWRWREQHHQRRTEHRFARPGLEPRCGPRPGQHSRHRQKFSIWLSWRGRSRRVPTPTSCRHRTIQTLDNEEAKFLVGQNIPLITGSFTQPAGKAHQSVSDVRAQGHRHCNCA